MNIILLTLLSSAYVSLSHDQSHVPLVGEFGLLSQPEGVVDGECVYCHGQALGVDFGELFSSRIISATVDVNWVMGI